MINHSRSLASLMTVLLIGGVSPAGEWPGWRGPSGQGQTDEKGLPLTWGGPKNENVLWKMPLPGTDARQDQNQSSPIVCRDRVFITASFWPKGVEQKDFPEHHVVCYSVKDGKQLWDVTVPPGPWLLRDLRGGYTAPTPACDGEHVYVFFGSAVLAALDLDGKILWRKTIVPYQYDVAIGNSPLVYQGTVLLMCEQMKKSSRLLAFDARSGEQKWEQKRPDADWTHSTPLLAEVKGKTQLLVAGAESLQGLDPATGKVLWWCREPSGKRIGDTVTPVLAGGVVYCDSGRGGPGIAVDPTGEGDVSKTHQKWKIAQVPEGFSSPVASGDYLYRLHSPDILKCWKLADGKTVFSERLQGVSSSSSPIATADGHIYCASAATSYLLKAGATFEVLSKNELGDGSPASPAVADGKLFLKGRRFLWCIGKK
jgi:outer membrane protein assembly factor BamB